jgi:hypothetical protein
MANNRKTQTALTLTFLMLLGLTMPGCETRGDFVALDSSTAAGWLAIESGVDGFETAWLLVAPDGTELYGSGDSLITDPQAGEYLILWEPVEEWNSPASNPDSRTFTDGSTETFVGSYAKIQGGMGDIMVNPDPKELRARWNLHGPDGFFVAGKGRRNLKRRAIGEYTVVWGSMDGYTTPAQARSMLQESATLELRANYAPVVVPVGTIEIDPNPDTLDAPWQLESDAGGVFSGNGDSVLVELPVAAYTITWGAVGGFETPAPSTAVLDSAATLHLGAVYVGVSEPVGTIGINPDPDLLQAPWQLTSEGSAQYTGSGDSTLTGLPLDKYVIVWGAVDGYVTPEPAAAILEEGVPLQFMVTYEAAVAPVGTVLIDPNPDSILAPWQLESDAGLIYSGAGDSTLVDVPMGTYTLTWGEVEGFETPSPNPVSQLLEPGASAVFAIH